jgi:hypothetical protein
VLSSYSLGEIICNRGSNGRIVKWLAELGEFDIEFFPRLAIKSPILANFVSQRTEIQMPPPEERPEHWKIYLTTHLTSKVQEQECYSSLLRESISNTSYKYIIRPPTMEQSTRL